MKQRLFITATGTGIGKSFITAALVRQAMSLGRSVAAFKPVISGFDPAQVMGSDTGLLLNSLNRPVTQENIEKMSPWRFSAPLAPSMAAAREHKSIDFDALVAHSQKVVKGDEDLVLIEGVGGVMVPLDHRHTVLDWIEAIPMTTVMVTGTYLGSISHTLTALAALHQRAIPIHSVIVNETENASVSLQETVDELARWTNLSLIPVSHRAAGDAWQNVPELKALIA